MKGYVRDATIGTGGGTPVGEVFSHTLVTRYCYVWMFVSNFGKATNQTLSDCNLAAPVIQ